MKTDLYVLTPYVFLKEERELFSMATYFTMHNTAEMTALLQQCRLPQEYGVLIRKYGQSIVNIAVDNSFICPLDDRYLQHHIQLMEIETTNYCNYRCVYCPVAFSPPKELKTMEMSVFHHVLKQAKENQIKKISLNFYNEPTLDPCFTARVESIDREGLKLILHTNASGFTHEKLVQLIEHKNCIDAIVINIPSLEPETFRAMTGRELSDRLLKNIDRLLQSGLRIHFSVNGTNGEIHRNHIKIKEKYSMKYPCQIHCSVSNDRAGILKNKYDQHIHLHGKLSGCDRLLHCVNVSWNGELFSCCNDYFKNYVFGNLRESSLREILKSDTYQRFFRQVFGEMESEDTFMCRHCSYMQFINRNAQYKRLIDILTSESMDSEAH